MTGSPAGVAAVAGAMNFRDVGGLGAGVHRTRSGVLFRSGNLARLADDDRAAVRALGIRRVIDLRADEEVAREPNLLGDLEIETVRAPLFLGSVASFFVNDVALPEMYRGLVDTGAGRIVEVVRAVLGARPVLVHCTIGKDRTGVAVAVMLAAAGVDEDAVIADYARTETLLPPERNAQVLAYLRRLHPDARHLEALATRSPAEVMRGLLDDIGARYGSAVGYLRSNGVTDVELVALREALITS